MAARSISLPVLASALTIALVAPAGATVSIVAVDPSTGEVGVAAASCVQIDLARIATVLPGVGVAVSQGHQRREDPVRLLEALRQSPRSSEALDRVASAPPNRDSRSLQYGVVMLRGGVAMRTGTGADPVAAEASADTVVVLGTDLRSQDVVGRARKAFLRARGDLAARLIAGLTASSTAGGDRRCHTQTATAAFVIVASPGQGPVVPIRGLPGVARRRKEVLKMVGKTVAADELGDLLRDACGLRRPTGPGRPDLYLSLIQPAHGFNAVTLLAQAYRQLLSTPTPTPAPSPSPTKPASQIPQAGGGGSGGQRLYLALAIVGVVALVGFRSRARRRRLRAGRVVDAVSRTKT